MAGNVVLFSGGFDSTAALLWSQQQTRSIALFVNYGQAGMQDEWEAARAIARDVAPLIRIDVEFPSGVPRCGQVEIPARNLWMASLAACYAKPHDFDKVVLGAIRLSAKEERRQVQPMADSSTDVIRVMDRAVRATTNNAVSLIAPWSQKTKGQVLGWMKQQKLMPQVWLTYSCHRANGPCGYCSACQARADVGI